MATQPTSKQSLDTDADAERFVQPNDAERLAGVGLFSTRLHAIAPNSRPVPTSTSGS